MVPFGVAFGIACIEAGLSVWQASAFSALVFTGSAQFAAVEVIGDGGSAVSAVVAGLLLNLRSLAFGVVMAPALSGPRWQRALWSQLMIDESTAIGSAQGERRWRRYGYLCGGLAVFVSWNVSTLVGAVGLSSTGDLIADWGIDATIPAAFLALVWPRLQDEAQRRSALAGALIALALVPVAPPGIPIVAAGLGVALGWRSGGRGAPAETGPTPDPGTPVDRSAPVSAPGGASSDLPDRRSAAMLGGPAFDGPPPPTAAGRSSATPAGAASDVPATAGGRRSDPPVGQAEA